MEVGSSSNNDDSQVQFNGFFPNSSENVNNLDFNGDYRLFDVHIDLLFCQSLPNNIQQQNHYDFIDLMMLPDEDVDIDVVPLNMNNNPGAEEALLNQNIEWTFRKTLTVSDCKPNQLRLLIPKKVAEDHIMPFFSESDQLQVKTRDGLPIDVFDYDTKRAVQMTFKKWESISSYSLMGNWLQDFVIFRALIPGDEVGLRWDVVSNRLLFSVLNRNLNPIHQD